MKNILISFLFGLISSIIFGTIVFFAMYFLLQLPLPINLDNERSFYVVFYSFITIVILITILGSITGVVYSRKYKK